MYKEIIGLLICPICRGDLQLIDSKEYCGEIISGKLACSNGHHWNIREGILDFQSKEQEITYRSSDSFNKEGLKKYPSVTGYKFPENLKRMSAKTFVKVEVYTKKEDSEYFIEADGRNSILKKLIAEADPNTQILSTNPSFEILKNNRKEMQRLNKAAKVNYIACDASRLPFRDNSVDVAVSCTGISSEENN